MRFRKTTAAIALTANMLTPSCSFFEQDPLTENIQTTYVSDTEATHQDDGTEEVGLQEGSIIQDNVTQSLENGGDYTDSPWTQQYAYDSGIKEFVSQREEVLPPLQKQLLLINRGAEALLQLDVVVVPVTGFDGPDYNIPGLHQSEIHSGGHAETISNFLEGAFMGLVQVDTTIRQTTEPITFDEEALGNGCLDMLTESFARHSAEHGASIHESNVESGYHADAIVLAYKAPGCKDDLPGYDNEQKISGIALTGSNQSIAVINSLADSPEWTIGHEIGHLAGLPHEGDQTCDVGGCSISPTRGASIMAYRDIPTTGKFSLAELDQLRLLDQFTLARPEGNFQNIYLRPTTSDTPGPAGIQLGTLSGRSLVYITYEADPLPDEGDDMPDSCEISELPRTSVQVRLVPLDNYPSTILVRPPDQQVEHCPRSGITEEGETIEVLEYTITLGQKIDDRQEVIITRDDNYNGHDSNQPTK
jgi:hypothetical protein